MHDTIEDIKNILEITILLLAGIIAFRINWKFVPVIFLDISSEWIDQQNGKLRLKLTLENKSNVKAVKKLVRLQVLEYDLSKIHLLSEWVPFEEKQIKPDELPLQWREPIPVWTTTKQLYPGEITSLDYMCACPQNRLLHIGLFFDGKPDFFSKILKLDESWCTTKIVANSLS